MTYSSYGGAPVVVTGAASGIGARTAELLAERGARVLCADRDIAGAEAIANGIGMLGGTAVAHEVDVTSLASTEDMAAACVAAFGGIAGLCTSAGISGHRDAVDLDPDLWARVLAVNLTGTWHSARAVLPAMVEAGSGSIVTIASIAGLVGTPLAACYAASKAGVIGLTRQMAVDFGPRGIRVNAVCPGTVPTPLVARTLHTQGVVTATEVRANLEAHTSRLPMRRLGTVDDIAATVAHLLSDDASWTTGAVHAVDGGLTASGWT
jgi:3-oxoacyl-[acyl-carrier protein] reductase